MITHRHIVIDLETLALTPKAVILSIGAISNSGEKFYLELDWREQQVYREVDPDTCLWWGQQNKDICPLSGDVFLLHALQQLQEWLPQNKEDFKIWCRGTIFDIPILESAMKQFALPIPWSYRNVRDIRTALDLKGYPRDFWARSKIPHNALSDAEADMQNLIDVQIVEPNEYV